MNREEARVFGQELQRLRKERGISLEEISRETKIRKVVLEAFESGRFDELPPEVFSVGFLKAFAQRIGAPPDPLVARFQRILRPPSPLPAPQKPRRGRRVLPWVLLLGLLAGAGVVLWLTLGGSALAPLPKGEPTPPAPKALPETPPPPPALPEPPREEPAPFQHAPPSPQAAPASPPLSPPPASAPGEVPASPPAATPPPAGDLVIRASGPCWVELWSGEKRLLRRELKAGEVVAFPGDRFRADFGNSGAVEVTFRGRAVPLQGAPGKVVKGVVIPPPAVGGDP